MYADRRRNVTEFRKSPTNFPFSVNICDTLNRFREKLVEILLNIQLTILDFILEPAERLFPNKAEACYPAQRFGGCASSCCRSRLPASRSQSTTVLSIKNRHHLTVHQRRTISENFNFRWTFTFCMRKRVPRWYCKWWWINLPMLIGPF
jgi:hypothetical protein